MTHRPDASGAAGTLLRAGGMVDLIATSNQNKFARKDGRSGRIRTCDPCVPNARSEQKTQQKQIRLTTFDHLYLRLFTGFRWSIGGLASRNLVQEASLFLRENFNGLASLAVKNLRFSSLAKITDCTAVVNGNVAVRTRLPRWLSDEPTRRYCRVVGKIEFQVDWLACETPVAVSGPVAMATRPVSICGTASTSARV
jgi:hypothetical protein